MANKPRVLIVEDDFEIQELLERTFLDNGCVPMCAFNGRDALEKIDTETPDLILLDIGLPGMDGFEVCSKFRARENTELTPIVMMTGDVSSKRLVRCLETGADDFIPKPFNIAEFNAKINAILRKKFVQDRYISVNRKLLENVNDSNKKLHKLYLETMKSLVTVIDAKDHYTYKHSRDVAKFSKLIGKQLGLNKKELDSIEQAGQLHDLGKIGISDAILNKKEELTESDWKEIRQHPLKSTQILEPLEQMSDIIEMVRHHHERMDGTGYPDRLKGKEISIGARILAVADSYDAITRERPYRKAFPLEQAIQEMEKNKGTQFDPEVLGVLLKFLKKGS